MATILLQIYPPSTADTQRKVLLGGARDLTYDCDSVAQVCLWYHVEYADVDLLGNFRRVTCCLCTLALDQGQKPFLEYVLVA